MKKKQYAIFGIGRFGSSVAQTLAADGCEVLAVDKDRERVEEIADEVSCAVCADVTNPKAVRSLGLDAIDVAVIGLSEDMEASIFATILVKDEKVPFVVAKASSDLHAEILRKVGADMVIFPERDSGIRMARNLLTGSFDDLYSLSDNVSVAEMRIPHAWIGETLRSLKIRDRYRINVVAIKHGDEVRADLDPDEALWEHLVLVLIGNNSDLEKMRKKIKE